MVSSLNTSVIVKENAVSGPDTDKVFAGSVPKLYEMYLVPLIFEPYAADLVSRVATRSPSRVLELAAGTGVVTRKLASVLPDSVSIIATDLNQPMLDLASEVGVRRTRCNSPSKAVYLTPWCASSESCSFRKRRRRFPRRGESSSQAAFSCSTCGTESRRTNSLTL